MTEGHDMGWIILLFTVATTAYVLKTLVDVCRSTRIRWAKKTFFIVALVVMSFFLWDACLSAFVYFQQSQG